MAGDIEVRPVRPDEYAAAGMATARAFREFAPDGDAEWAGYITSIADIATRVQRTIVLVALLDGVIAGTATIEIDQHVEDDWAAPVAPDEAHLRMLGVDPAHRRRGVARALTDAVLALARERGRQRITLETMVEMDAARGMYESMGFIERGRRDAEPSLVLVDYELRLPAR